MNEYGGNNMKKIAKYLKKAFELYGENLIKSERI